MKNEVILLPLLLSCLYALAQEQAEKQVAQQAIHPRSREWATLFADRGGRVYPIRKATLSFTTKTIAVSRRKYPAAP